MTMAVTRACSIQCRANLRIVVLGGALQCIPFTTKSAPALHLTLEGVEESNNLDLSENTRIEGGSRQIGVDKEDGEHSSFEPEIIHPRSLSEDDVSGCRSICKNSRFKNSSCEDPSQRLDDRDSNGASSSASCSWHAQSYSCRLSRSRGDLGSCRTSIGDGAGPPPPPPVIPWDAEVAAHCERVTLLPAPVVPPLPLEQRRRAAADPGHLAELRSAICDGRLADALTTAQVMADCDGGPPLAVLCELAEAAASRADSAALERCRRLAAQLYPAGYQALQQLLPARLELLWRRGRFEAALALLLRYVGREDGVWQQVMLRRAAVCCCLAAEHGVNEALPHIEKAALAAAERRSPHLLLSAWQRCVSSEQHGWQQAGRRLLAAAPAARPLLPPYLLATVEAAQLAGHHELLRRLPEHVLAVGETGLYPLVFGALLDFQCLIEDVRSARETFRLVNDMSIPLPSSVLNRYFSLLSRHRLRAPAALLRMKSRKLPPDDLGEKPIPPPKAWWRNW